MNNGQQFRFGTVWSKEHFNGEIAFGNMRAAFTEALTRYPNELQESFYVLGGQNVRIRIVGRDLAKYICRPFSHLRTNGQRPATPQLTIDLWDKNVDHQGPSTLENLKWFEQTVKSADGRFVGQQLPHTFSCLDRQTGQIVSSIAWHDCIFIYERAKPLARPLLEWHNDRGIQVIHAGLVAQDGRGALFVGKSGSGKSTSSLICLCAGFDYLSEDYIGLERRQDGTFVGHSLYNSVFLETAHLTRFTELMPYAIKGRPPQEEKSVIILSQVFPERLERTAPIRVLVLPRVVDTPTSEFRPASKGEALLALGPSSLLQIPNKELGVRGFDKLVQLVERVPCYWLELGGDPRAIPSLVENILAEEMHSQTSL